VAHGFRVAAIRGDLDDAFVVEAVGVVFDGGSAFDPGQPAFGVPGERAFAVAEEAAGGVVGEALVAELREGVGAGVLLPESVVDVQVGGVVGGGDREQVRHGVVRPLGSADRVLGF